MKLPFVPGQIYKRSELHDDFAGNRQGGICPSRKYPYIFIFTGEAGKQHGYKDVWVNENMFSYTGEGQAGDMKFTKGNLALRDHVKNGKRIFLFEYVRTAYVKFISEMEYYDIGFFETHDTSKKSRQAIRFFLKRKGINIPVTPEEFNSPAIVEIPSFPSLIKIPEVTEKQALYKARIGQSAFRKSVIHRWEYQCAVTGFDRLDLLVASHIVPWKDSNNNERLDFNNGILLSPTYDALFDLHLITFENNGKILLSEEIEPEAYKKIGVTGKEKIKGLSDSNIEYLKVHQKGFH